VRVAGVLDALRVAEARGGGSVEFLTLEDAAGVFEVTVWPSAYQRIAARVRGLGPYVVTGRVEERMGALAVAAESVEPVKVHRGFPGGPEKGTTPLPGHPPSKMILP